MDTQSKIKKNISVILLEGLVVGLSVVAMMYLVDNYLLDYIPAFTRNKEIESAFLTGFLLHVLFEYTGVNLWYSLNYCSLAVL